MLYMIFLFVLMYTPVKIMVVKSTPYSAFVKWPHKFDHQLLKKTPQNGNFGELFCLMRMKSFRWLFFKSLWESHLFAIWSCWEKKLKFCYSKSRRLTLNSDIFTMLALEITLSRNINIHFYNECFAKKTCNTISQLEMFTNIKA